MHVPQLRECLQKVVQFEGPLPEAHRSETILVPALRKEFHAEWQFGPPPEEGAQDRGTNLGLVARDTSKPTNDLTISSEMKCIIGNHTLKKIE